MVSNKKNDFFSVGRKEPTNENVPQIEAVGDWKDIRPNSDIDALAKNQFKRKRYEEFKEKMDKVKKDFEKRHGNQVDYRSRPKNKRMKKEAPTPAAQFERAKDEKKSPE